MQDPAIKTRAQLIEGWHRRLTNVEQGAQSGALADCLADFYDDMEARNLERQGEWVDNLDNLRHSIENRLAKRVVIGLGVILLIISPALNVWGEDIARFLNRLF